MLPQTAGHGFKKIAGFLCVWKKIIKGSNSAQTFGLGNLIVFSAISVTVDKQSKWLQIGQSVTN